MRTGFFHGFFSVLDFTVCESFKYNKKPMDHLKILIYTLIQFFIHTYQCVFFWDFSSLAESEGKEHLPQNPPLELEKSTGGETMSLDDKNFMLCLFQ